MYRNQQQVTLIDDLPDISDSNGILNHAQQEKYGKFIQSSHEAPMEAGMKNSYPQGHPQGHPQQGYPQGYPPHGHPEGHQQGHPQGYPPHGHPEGHQQGPPGYHGHMQQSPTSAQTMELYQTLEKFGGSCIGVAGHVENCPICSKLYKNDKSIYVIVIILLTILCILLLKRVLDI